MAFKCQVGERNSKTVKMQSWNQTRLATKKISTEWPKAMYTCNRKLKINTDNGRKIGANPPSVSCFDGLWSCIRCQLRTKNRKQFNYKENGVAKPQEFSSKDGVQNRHMDDQRSILPSKQLDAVSSTYAKEDMVNGVKTLKEDLQPDTKVSRIEPADRTTTMKLKMDHSTTFALKSIWKKYIIDGNAQGYIHSEKDINMAVDCAFTTRRYFNYDMAHFYLACLTIAFQYFIHRDMNPANLFPDFKGFLKLMKLKMDHSTTFALKSIWKKYIIDGNAQGYIHSEKDINMAVDCAFTTRRYFNYDMAHFYLACLTIAFQYFIHRDMNPANLFPDSKGFLKLVSQPQELSRSQGLTPQREQQQSGVDGQITDPYLPKLLEPKNIQLNDLAYVATLGQGGYGRVELMKLKTDHSSTFALKSICKKYIIDKNEQEDIHSEKDINMAVDCAFTTRMYWAHTDRKYIYMLLEVCLGGDLQRLLKRRRYFNYDMARFYTACTTLALQYLHTSGIIHRDVKPANLFPDSKGFLKLVSQPQELSRSQGLTPQREQQQSGVASQITDPYLPKLLEPKNIQLNDLAYVATLGQGGYGRVELMKLKTDHSSTFALKSICKKYIIDKNEQEDIHSEKDINMAVDCAFTTRMYWAHTDRKYIYMLLEVCLGGDLQRLLKRRRYFNYDMARFYTACTTLALQYLHTSGIIHRDVKPANLFLDSKGFLKLGDFGFAERINAGQKLWDPCGTVFYKAPEMFKVDGHDRNADYWSLGVVVFEMLCGRRPFEGCRQEETIRYILDGGIDMASFSPRVGLNARSLVKQLCHENPCRRAKGIKQHPWFLNFSWESLIARSMRPPYVPKDFFTHEYWSQLPDTWRSYLEDLQPPGLSFLLSSHQPHTGKVPPLSLLALHKCTNVLSLNRQKVNLDEDDVTKNVFSKGCDEAQKAISHHTNTNITTPTSAKEDIKDGQYLPLDSCFRKHVKPKKQHEILQLGRTIQLVSKQSHCGNVVDIGAGQGHLSRLLALGHGFKVTTVEAVGCHAPKAMKFDKDAQRDLDRANLKRKLSRPNIKDGIGVSLQSVDTAMEFAESGNVTLPEHLTCVIQPDTSVDEFQKIVQNSLKRVQQSHCVMLDEELKFKQTLAQDEKQNTEERSESNELRVVTNSKIDHCVHNDVAECVKSFNAESCIHSTTDRNRKRTEGDLPATQSPDSEYKDYAEDEKSRSRQFIMTGLHACGDLTTTMIRVYVGCEDIVGLASVACCYMKLSFKQGSGKSSQSVGYPMSDFVADLPDSFLSYEAREMACHFCDSYRERLIANPPNLKLHCYRAMLQCIIRKKDPSYCHGCVKLNVRHAETLSFEQYARMSLKCLGMEDSIPRDLLQEVESYLPFWKNVVSFYTLRLSLAPVVETLILLDRMIYLYEKGLCSSLVPIFDPLLSPRNFALVSVK